jgi:hypothetical protein
MNVVYEVNSNELNQDLLENIKMVLHSKIFEGKNIKIVISADDDQNNFEKLLKNVKENNEILKPEIIAEIEKRKNDKIISFNDLEKELKL